jgi:hypothetical protein
MAGPTMQIRAKTRDMLWELARETGQPIEEVLARAVESYYRNYLLERTNLVYAALRADPAAWREEEQERAAWNATLVDDLQPD